MTNLLPAVLTEDLGPAMRALNDQQRLFVTELATNGGNATRAAIAAGYSSKTPEGSRVTGHRLTHNPKVLAAIKEDAENRVHAGAGIAADVMMEILRSPTNKDRYKAAAHVLALAGLSPTIRHEHLIEPSKNAKELIAEIRDMAKGLGMDERKLLGTVVDAEFEEVVEAVEANAAVTSGREGLEDML